LKAIQKAFKDLLAKAFTLSANDPSRDIVEYMSGGITRAPLTLILLGANVAVFVAMLLSGAGLWHSPNAIQLAWGASFGPATKDGEWYRLAAAMFIHFGLWHLLMNAWALWDIGRLVERLYGSIRLLLIYFASGIVGNLLSLIAHGDHAVSGGASGAIFGLYGALLSFLWVARRQIYPPHFKWLFWGAVTFSAVIVGLGFLVPGIDNAAHVGGLISGMLSGGVLSPISYAGRYSRILTSVLFVTVVVLVIVAIPAPSYRWTEELQAQSGIKDFISNDQRIIGRWQSLLDMGRKDGLSFSELAERIDSDVTREYQESFEGLSALKLAPSAPSADELDAVRKYAQMRAEAAHLLAEGLRKNDKQSINEALKAARQADDIARGAKQREPLRAN